LQHRRTRRNVGRVTVFLVGGVIVIALMLGFAIGWLVRRAAHWCPRCGGNLCCVDCQHHPAFRLKTTDRLPVK
jgi:hypothetical protein